MTSPFEPRRFQSAVAFYEKYRLGYPDRLLRRVMALAGLVPGDAVLDLGCGPGTLAVPLARLGLTVTAMDPEPDMLVAVRVAAGDLPITIVQGSSYDLTADMGPFKLVTMGRSFHWTDRAATLDMLDRIVTPDGGVVFFHDAHPPVEENRWFKTLYDVGRKFGRDENEHIKERNGGHRRYEPFLFASAFTQLDWLSVTIRQPLTIDGLVGRAFSLSTCSPQKLGDRQEAFETALRASLREIAPDGNFTEIAELVALLARRPE